MWKSGSSIQGSYLIEKKRRWFVNKIKTHKHNSWFWKKKQRPKRRDIITKQIAANSEPLQEINK